MPVWCSVVLQSERSTRPQDWTRHSLVRAKLLLPMRKYRKHTGVRRKAATGIQNVRRSSGGHERAGGGADEETEPGLLFVGVTVFIMILFIIVHSVQTISLAQEAKPLLFVFAKEMKYSLSRCVFCIQSLYLKMIFKAVSRSDSFCCQQKSLLWPRQ